MKKIIFILITTFFSINFAQANVDTEYLKYIYKLIEDKQYQKAFEEHQYFFEESIKTPGLGAVRISYGLSSWAELGKVYPPAHAALVKMSDDRKSLILSGEKSSDVFHEYAAINRYIDKKHETIHTFLIVDKKFPDNAPRFYILTEALLVEEKKFDVVKKYLNDPIFKYENIRHRRELDLSQLRKKSPIRTIQEINSNFETEVKELIDITMKIGMQDEADEIKNRFESYFNGNLKRKYY
jgi:hypothetical protein